MNPRLFSSLLLAWALACLSPAVEGHREASFAELGSHGEDIMADLLEPCCVIVATIMISLLGFALWSSSVKASSDKARTPTSATTATTSSASPRGASGRGDGAMGWLAALVATSFLLLVLQLGAGFSTGALTLIADSAHTAADTVSYSFNWLVERAKRSAATSQSDRASRAAARFDALSAIFSVVILLCTSVCASADALHRLFGSGAAASTDHGAKEDLGLIGHALLGFAIVSTAINVLMLVLHRCRLGASSPTEVPPPPSPWVSDAISPPPPPPPAIPRQSGRDRAAKRNSRLALLHQAESVPASPPSVSDAILPPPPPPAISRQSGRERAAKRTNKLALLHQAFHPSCDLANCPVGAHGNGDVLPESSQAGFEQSAGSTEKETNLNLYGAVLHLLTDVLRSVVILVVGLLVELGVIRDAGNADAVCAIVVSICIVVGSLALLRAAAKTLCGKISDVTKHSSVSQANRLSPV